jgi:hypothetical protein
VRDTQCLPSPLIISRQEMKCDPHDSRGGTGRHEWARHGEFSSHLHLIFVKVISRDALFMSWGKIKLYSCVAWWGFEGGNPTESTTWRSDSRRFGQMQAGNGRKTKASSVRRHPTGVKFFARLRSENSQGMGDALGWVRGIRFYVWT